MRKNPCFLTKHRRRRMSVTCQLVLQSLQLYLVLIRCCVLQHLHSCQGNERSIAILLLPKERNGRKGLIVIPLKAFKAARYFSPHFVKKIKPECADLSSLQNLPFITPTRLLELRDEFPKYAVLTADLSCDYSSLKFWKDHELSIPKWSDAARNIFLLQPSSAAAERVFSVLNNSFGKKQLGSLEDYIETSVMLQFNKRGM